MVESLNNHLFCFGLGYCAKHLISILQNQEANSWQFSGTTRSSFSKTSSVNLYLFDELAYLPSNTTHVLISIPPTDLGDIAFSNFKNHLLHLKNLKWLGYLSSTGVYGDFDGAWVDEQSQTKATSEYAKNRLAAEKQWLSLYKDQKIPVHVFRLAGIYGPERNPLEKIMAGQGQIIEKPRQVFSRIHVEDIAGVLLHSMHSPTPGEIFNLSDDLPSSPAEVMLYAYKLLGLTPPKPVALDKANLSEVGARFYLESRRVKNDKIKQIFGIKLKHPTYKEGLKAIFEELKGK
jgi:nucleoside-diphosphate-sugar epimerase